MGITNDEMAFSDRGYWHFANNGRAFDQFGGFGPMMQQEGAPLEVDVARLTASAFELLRVSPALGRWPSAEEDQPGGTPVALVSDGLWRGTFGSDPAILGRTITLDGTIRQVIGVMPPQYAFPTSETDVWIPYQLDPANPNFGLHSISAIARLSPGATPVSATADAESLIGRFDEAGYTDGAWFTDVFTGEAVVRPLKEEVVGASTRPIAVLVATMGFVLLIAISNVANLFLVRSETRSHETAVRVALGSGRWRLIQSTLAEGILLGFVGGAAGVLLAWTGEMPACFLALRSRCSASPCWPALSRLSGQHASHRRKRCAGAENIPVPHHPNRLMKSSIASNPFSRSSIDAA